MKKKLVIFGTGEFALLVKYYFETDSPYQIVAFTVDDEIRETCASFEGLEVYGFSDIELVFPPNEYEMFIAIGYSKMNANREKKFYEAKAKGYKLASFVSSLSHNLSQFPVGENCCFFEHSSIQPFAKVGNNVIVWGYCGIGHHSVVEDHNFIAAYVIVGGHAIIKSNCFLGNRSTINPSIIIAEKTLVGTGAIITKNTSPESVYISPRSIKMPTKSGKIEL